MQKISAAEMAHKAAVEITRNAKCRRCGEDPDKAHDNEWCPAFSKTGEVGRWLNFSDLYSALRAELGGNLEIRPSCRTENREGPAGEWFNVVGLYRDGEYIGRFDAPYVPEYSLWADRRGQHSMLLKGWRASLRDLATKTGVRFERIAKRLAVNSDRTSEEIVRFGVGYL